MAKARMFGFRAAILCAGLLLGLASCASGQSGELPDAAASSPPAAGPQQPGESSSGANPAGFHAAFGKTLARDQAAIWTAPARLDLADATWLLPLAGLTAGMIATDREVSRRNIKGRPFWSRVWVLASTPTERNALNG